MNSGIKVAVVTGANRGLGKEMVRQLAKLNQYRVILTSRDEQKGKQAVDELVADGCQNVECYPLDVTSEDGIEDLRVYILDTYGRCDILINNAGIFPDADCGTVSGDWGSVLKSDLQTFHKAMETNVFGVLKLSQRLIPLMRRNNYGRIVNVSSLMGQFSHLDHRAPAYRLSKTALNALTKMMASELESTNILVNSMSPGWVRTDMGSSNANRSVEEGVETMVWLATLPDDGPRGGYFQDKKSMEW